MKKRHGSVICRGAFCDGMGCILHHPLCGCSPSFCGTRQWVAAKPPQVTISCPPDTRRWTEAVCQLSDRPPSAPTYELVSFLTLAGRGGSVSRRDQPKPIGDRPHSQAEPTMQKSTRQTPAALRERGSGGEALLSEKRPLPQSPSRRKVAAALSAAVTTTKLIGDTPTLRRNHPCRSNPAERQLLFGREGSGGRGASLREAASPPSVPPPHRLFGEGARGRGASLQRSSPPSQYPSLYTSSTKLVMS